MDEQVRVRLRPHCEKAKRAEVGLAALPMGRGLLRASDHVLAFIPMTEEEKAAYGGDVHTWVIRIVPEKTEVEYRDEEGARGLCVEPTDVSKEV